MKLHLVIALFLILNVYSCKPLTSTEKSKTFNTIGSIQVNDPRMLEVIDTTQKIEILTDGFSWSEGPLWLDNYKKLIFTDVPENTIYSWDSKNGKQIYLKPSGYTISDTTGGTEGANGLALDASGKLILAQHGNRSVALMNTSLDKPEPTFTFLTQKYNGKRFSSPNDLHIAKDGSIFFTDPPYGLPGLDEAPAKEIAFNGVYRLFPDGKVILLDSTLTKPNGIALSQDEMTMYVANSDPDKAIYMEYKLDKEKNIVSKRVFADKTTDVKSLKGLPDGLKIGKKGHIYATGPGGVLVFHPDGTHLGTVLTENATANCALDTRNEYLYMTAHKLLLRLKLK